MAGSSRFDKLYSIMRLAGPDIVALVPGPNLYYLTGSVHYLLERPIVLFIPLDQEPLAVIPQLEIPLFERHASPPRLFVYSDDKGYADAFSAASTALGAHGKTIGVEGLHMRFFEGELIRHSMPGATVLDANDALAELRLIKDADEISFLRRAIEISERALRAMLDDLQIGMSERELAAILESHIIALGGEGLAFHTILHAGGNTALPHSGPLDYRIRYGDPLLVDFGAAFKGYCADITRIFFIGEARPEYRPLYTAVQGANKAGRLAARPGVTAESVDLAARQVIIEAGYEQLMRHRTGHGLGLQAHEAPYIVKGNCRLLEPGMVFTVEPGIYRLGEIGIRIEDNVLITENGAESLTTFPRDLQVI